MSVSRTPTILWTICYVEVKRTIVINNLLLSHPYLVLISPLLILVIVVLILIFNLRPPSSLKEIAELINGSPRRNLFLNIIIAGQYKERQVKYVFAGRGQGITTERIIITPKVIHPTQQNKMFMDKFFFDGKYLVCKNDGLIWNKPWAIEDIVKLLNDLTRSAEIIESGSQV